MAGVTLVLFYLGGACVWTVCRRPKSGVFSSTNSDCCTGFFFLERPPRRFFAFLLHPASCDVC